MPLQTESGKRRVFQSQIALWKNSAGSGTVTAPSWANHVGIWMWSKGATASGSDPGDGGASGAHSNGYYACVAADDFNWEITAGGQTTVTGPGGLNMVCTAASGRTTVGVATGGLNNSNGNAGGSSGSSSGGSGGTAPTPGVTGNQMGPGWAPGGIGPSGGSKNNDGSNGGHPGAGGSGPGKNGSNAGAGGDPRIVIVFYEE